VTGLATHHLAGTHDDIGPSVQTEATEVVGNRGVIGSGHRQLLVEMREP
jgi:hypothetical protein